jgi:aminoglycoside phosphotransferase (APT) family kinase protein
VAAVVSLGRIERASCILLTPRFRTSRHVVGLVVPEGGVEPKLVVKMPRVPGDGGGLAREAAVLTAVHEGWPDISRTIPRIVAFEEGDCPVLVETALAGRLLTPAMFRREPTRYVDAVVAWLIGMAATRRNGIEPGWYERIVERPLKNVAESLPLPADQVDLVKRTLELVEPLREAEIPEVVEHGDLSYPNLIWTGENRVGVVDWELAEEHGLPLQDLAYFLTYATFALRRPADTTAQVAAFHDAFFARGGWARARVEAYARDLSLDRELLTPLFVSCWARSVARLVDRIGGEAAAPMSEEAVAWVQGNRYYALWRHAVTHADELVW